MGVYFDFLDHLPNNENVETRKKHDELTFYLHHELDDGQINGVYGVNCSERRIDELIQEVEEFYKIRNKRFHWTLHSRNQKLEEKLIENKYNLVSNCYLLGFEVSEHSLIAFSNKIPQNNVEVRKVDLQSIINDDEVIYILTRTFGGDAESTRRLLQNQIEQQINGGIVLPQWVGFLDNKPVGTASLEVLPDYNVVRLNSAATLKEFRGQGVYSALTKARLEYCLQDGKDLVIIDADKKTSAPILMKYGFKVLDEIREYALVKAHDIEY